MTRDPEQGKSGSAGSRPGPDKTRLRAARYIALATQMPFVILGGYFLGYYLDQYFEISYLRIVFTLAAIFGAFFQLIREVMKETSEDSAKPPDRQRK